LAIRTAKENRGRKGLAMPRKYPRNPGLCPSICLFTEPVPLAKKQGNSGERMRRSSGTAETEESVMGLNAFLIERERGRDPRRLDRCFPALSLH